MLHYRSIAVAFAALVLAAPLTARLGAQGVAPAAAVTDSLAPAVATSAPTQSAAAVAPSPVGVRALSALNTPLAMPAPAQNSHNTALMIVGGATLIVGAIIGGRTGTIVMVGGGVIGLVGLWNYLQ